MPRTRPTAPTTGSGVNVSTPPGNLYDPYGLVTQGPAVSGTSSQTEDWWMQSPEMANAMISLMRLGLDDAQAMATIQWYYDQMENDRQTTQETLAVRRYEARIAASSGNSQARIAADARLQEAQIAADNAMAIAQLDVSARLKMAADEIADRAQARIAEETSRPSDWPYQLALLKNRNPATAPRTGVQTALGVPRADTIYARNEPQTQQGDQAWQAFSSGQPSAAVVGDAGPEIIEETPRGTYVMPINTPDRARRAQMLPRMALGGVVRDVEEPIPPPPFPFPVDETPPVTPSAATYRAPAAGGRRYAYNPYNPAIGGYSTGVGNWGAASRMPGAAWGKTSPAAKARADAAAHGYVIPGWAQARRPVPFSGGFATQGTAGGGGNPPVSVEPPVTTPTPGDLTDFTSILFDPWAAFQATSASRDLPGGLHADRWPWEENLTEFINAPTQVQAARLAAWRQAGVIEGETTQEMWESAMQMMRQSAPLGSGRALVGYR